MIVWWLVGCLVVADLALLVVVVRDLRRGLDDPDRD